MFVCYRLVVFAFVLLFQLVSLQNAFELNLKWKGHLNFLISTLRSWQTPPQQPTPQKESEAERKAKSRLQRASRRSTQGVTLDQLNEARSAANSPTVNSSSTNNSTDTTNSTKNDDIGKWKSSALQQQTSKVS